MEPSIDIMPKLQTPTPSAVLGVKPLAPPPAPRVPEMRSFGDAKETRRAIYENSLAAAQNVEPLEDDKFHLRLTNVDWMDPERFTRKRRKEAVLTGATLARRLRGTWELTDKATGAVQKRNQVVGAVPYLSSMGTFVDRGNEYTVNHQQRLLPGVFARTKDNGELESHFNVLPGKGVSHRYFLDPAKSQIKMKLGQAEMPLMPLLRAMGTTDREIRDAWGDQIWQANYGTNDASVLKKLSDRLLKKSDLATGDAQSLTQKLVERFNSMELDPEVTKHTLKHPHSRVTKEAILAATGKLIRINKGEDEPDDRDHLAFQRFYGPEDLFAERIARDHGGHRRGIFRELSRAGNLDKMPSGALTKQIRQVLIGSGLSQALEEINPAEVFDKQSRITRLGEGGIPSVDSIPDEARSVQPSHMGFMDPIRTPESFRVGVDLHMARNARKGRDGKIYTQLRDRSGNTVWKTPQDIADSSIATSDAMKWDTDQVPVQKAGKQDYVPKDQVDYVVPHYENIFSPLANLVPMKSAVKAGRVAMGARYMTQALPLQNAEAPYVQGAVPGDPNGNSFEQEHGKHMGAIHADKGGRVMGIADGVVHVKYEDGTKDQIELYQNHPFNRKTYIHQDPVLQPGDTFKPGQLLARSNYTDPEGTTALGLNMRVAYFPYKGLNFEDAQVISESAAKRLSSEHMYQHELEVTPKHKVGLKGYISMFPSAYDKKTLARMDDKGIIRAGETVEFGQPLILAAKERDRSQNKIHKKRQPGYADESVVWKHHDPGVVTDVVWGKNGPVVLVKSVSQMQVGDKMSGRYGDKGVVAAIIPDAQMPHDKDGKPFEVLLSPDGTITRTNPSQTIEASLGKIASVTGKPIKVPDFEDIDDLQEWTDKQLAIHGLSRTEDVVWPEKQVKVPGVGTGNRFFMKLHHTAESKEQGRDSGAYSADETPAKGGESGSKRISLLDVNALLSHGATETLRDGGAIRGQKNEDWWMQFISGHAPNAPRVPMVYEKFVNQLKASGINVVRDGHRTHVMALTNKDVDTLSGDREIGNGETVNFDKDLKPVRNGLFDERLTGGHGGKKWSHIKLPEPMPNPVMEEPIRHMLDLTQKEYESVLSGDMEVAQFGSGPKAIARALDNIDVDKELQKVKAQFHSAKGSKRDQAVRKWGYLKSAKRLDLHPREWLLDKVPVLPPSFRPVSMMGDSGIPLISDPNYMYKELLDAKKNYADMVKHVGTEGAGPERLAVYHAFKAVTGLGDPVHPKLQEKGVKGILKTVFGNSPKFGTVQRKLISSTVDNVGRAVITPNPDFDMDTIGVPEEQAFKVYRKMMVRRLRRRGMPIRDALKHIADKSDLARDVLLEEMENRPVYANRAPVLHRFGIMAFKPKLVKGSVLQVSPLIVSGFNADFDGDAMQFHVPTTDEAVKEAYDKMLPSRNLLSPSDFKSPVHKPGQQYLAGLYHATRKHEEGKFKRRTKQYRSTEDAIAAYHRGEIRAEDNVEIINH